MESKFERKFKFSWILVAAQKETKHRNYIKTNFLKWKNYYLLGGHPLHIK